MEYYFIFNSLVTIVVLSFSKYVAASASYRFYLVSFALAMWVIPWHLLDTLIPIKNQIARHWILPQIAFSSDNFKADNSNNWHTFLNWHALLTTLFAIGFVLLIKKLVIHWLWVKKLQASHYQVLEHKELAVYQSNAISGAVLVGLFRPKIWISSSIKSRSIKNAIIEHEKQHFYRNDNVKLLILTVIESLFWWNPLVISLVKQARFLIEVLCDQAAEKAVGKDQYLTALSELIYFQTQNLNPNLSSYALSTHNNNINRIKLLKDKPTMNFTKKLGYFSIVITAIFSITFYTFSSKAISTAINANQETMINLDEKMSANFENIPLQEFFKLVASFAKLDNVNVDSTVSNQKISLNVKTIPLRTLFKELSEKHNIAISIDDKTINVKPLNGGFKTAEEIIYQSIENPDGALVNFNIKITSTDSSNVQHLTTAEFQIWSNFNKQAFVKIGNDLQLAIKIKEVEQGALFDVKIIESLDTPEMKVLAEPRLIAEFSKLAVVEFNNKEMNKLVSIEMLAEKTKQPSNS